MSGLFPTSSELDQTALFVPLVALLSMKGILNVFHYIDQLVYRDLCLNVKHVIFNLLLYRNKNASTAERHMGMPLPVRPHALVIAIVKSRL